MPVVRFTDFTGTLKTIAVGSTQQPIVKGSPSSFSVSEDASEDMFVPVRTQSGYIKFIDTEGVWEQFLPNAGSYMQVTLDGQWQGFVNMPEAGFPYKEIAPEISIPVMCPLSVLGTFDFDPGQGQLIPIHECVAYITRNYYSNTGHQINLDDTPASLVNYTDLLVSTGIFYDTDADGNVTPKYTCLGALEEICKALGMTVRWKGLQGVFEIADQPSETVLTLTSPFADVHQEQGYFQGWREATVTPEQIELSSLLMIPGEEVKNDILREQNTPEVILLDGSTSDGKFARVAGERAGTAAGYVINGEQMDTTLYAPTGGPAANVQVYEYWEGSNRDYGNNWICSLLIGAEAATSDPCVVIESRDIFNLYGSYLNITADVSEYYTPVDESIEGSVTAELSIGNYYYNGRSWVTSAATFPIKFNKHTMGLHAVETIEKGLKAHILGYSKISGKVTLKIYGYSKDSGTNNNFLNLNNFKIDIGRNNPDYLGNKDNRYKAENSSRFRNKLQQSIIFSSDNPAKYLANCLYSTTGAPIVDDFTIGNFTGRPEQWLANRMSDYGSARRKWLKLNVRGIIDNTLNFQIDNVNYHCYAVSYDYEENTTTLNLIQI